MLRNIQKAIRPLATTSRSGAFQPGLRRLAFSTLRTVPRNGTPKPSGGHFCARRYVTNSPEQSQKVSEDPKDIRWLDYLEAVSQASWLSSTPSSQEDILKRSYFLVFQIILYLARPMSNDPKEAQDASTNFLLLFTSSQVRPDSEIGRSRYAIAVITKQLTKDISSIPSSSDLRTKHSSAFDLADALVSPCDDYLEQLEQNKPPLNGEIVEGGKWHDFWSKVQPTVLALGEVLDKEGYGITEEMLKEAVAEKEKRKKEEAKQKK